MKKENGVTASVLIIVVTILFIITGVIINIVAGK